MNNWIGAGSGGHRSGQRKQHMQRPGDLEIGMYLRNIQSFGWPAPEWRVYGESEGTTEIGRD